jgi:hypothetical protein
VFPFARERLREEQSGVAGQQPFSQIATVRDGRVIFIEYFLDDEHPSPRLR